MPHACHHRSVMAQHKMGQSAGRGVGLFFIVTGESTNDLEAIAHLWQAGLPINGIAER